jgi:hypothetical protein
MEKEEKYWKNKDRKERGQVFILDKIQYSF